VVEHFLEHRHGERRETQNPRRRTRNSVTSRGQFHRKSLRAARYIEHISQVGSNSRFSAAMWSCRIQNKQHSDTPSHAAQ
jgi:hypothetical protein